MEKNILSVVINRPVQEVFGFALNPINSPKWIDGMLEETATPWPAEKGTFYHEKWVDGSESGYELIELTSPTTFTMKKSGDTYHVRYEFEVVEDSVTQMTYSEWVESGVLEDPFTQSALDKLKVVIENGN